MMLMAIVMMKINNNHHYQITWVDLNSLNKTTTTIMMMMMVMMMMSFMTKTLLRLFEGWFQRRVFDLPVGHRFHKWQCDISSAQICARFKALVPALYGRYFADDISNAFFSTTITYLSKSHDFIINRPFGNKSAFFQAKAWRQTPNKHHLSQWWLTAPRHIVIIKPQLVISNSPWTTWPPFRRRCFQMHFRRWEVCILIQI